MNDEIILGGKRKMDAMASIYLAAVIAFASCAFGVFMARAFWAEDLEHARKIDKINKEQIHSMEIIIQTKNRTIELYEKRISLIENNCKP